MKPDYFTQTQKQFTSTVNHNMLLVNDMMAKTNGFSIVKQLYAPLWMVFMPIPTKVVDTAS